MSENKKPALNMRYYNGEIDDDLPYTGVLNYDEETGLCLLYTSPSPRD